ncbi:hypothetical protein RJ639_043564 [Escallonia herrerae]|uniref:Uncharacterized protein n=1 Tax=Escallonia herrerae TaxID=1293975 RepID=A0AA89B2S8_9ASTE|nr:hypothetical protein RJ639_043564 [Escallonia herrerae]
MACGAENEDPCEYFIWIDPPLCERAVQVIPGLLRRINGNAEETSRKPDTLLPFFDATAIALHGYDLRPSSISLTYKRPSPTLRNNPSEKSFLMLGSAAAMLPPESTDSRYQQCSSRFPQTFTRIVITNITKAVTFVRISLLSVTPKEGKKFPIVVHMKAVLLSFASCSVYPGMESLTSPGSFVAMANDVRAVALRVKKLQGNQNFLRRKPWTASVAIKRVQISDTAAITAVNLLLWVVEGQGGVGAVERIADGKPAYKFNFAWQSSLYVLGNPFAHETCNSLET